MLELLGVSHEGLDDAAKDAVGLTVWLSENAASARWPAEELLADARECYDDFEMGFRAWRVLGDDAELPKWNAALSALGDRYEQVGNVQAEAQAKRRLDEAARWQRAFARHVATADAGVSIVDQGRLFLKVNAVPERWAKGLSGHLGGAWSREWWRVPVAAVFDELRARHEKIEEAGPHVGVFEGVTSIGGFRSALERLGVALEPDPLEVARGNQRRLDKAVRGVRETYQAWLKKEDSEPASSASEPEVRLDDSMYLREWPEDDLFERAKLAVADRDFQDAVAGCTDMEAMRRELDIQPRINGGRTDPAPRRDVAGVPEPVDSSDENYRNIFERLEELSEPPDGPDADLDEMTPLRDPVPDPPPDPPPNGGTEGARRGPKTGHLHGSPHLPEFIGIIGEMQAFRFLKDKFGIDVSAWVSEFRNRIVPLLDGEKDMTSDSHGYDFRFTHRGKTWCVEVKATTGDDTSFELSSGELAAASRIAPGKDERWRILRVRGALSERPVCDWLPNPFEPGAGEQLRLRQGGVTVEYTLPDPAGRPGP